MWQKKKKKKKVVFWISFMSNSSINLDEFHIVLMKCDRYRGRIDEKLPSKCHNVTRVEK